MRDGRETSLLPTELFRCHLAECMHRYLCMNRRTKKRLSLSIWHLLCDEMKRKIFASLTTKHTEIFASVAIGGLWQSQCNVSWIMISDYHVDVTHFSDGGWSLMRLKNVHAADTEWARRAASRIEVAINIFQRTITNKLTFNLHHISWRSVLTHFELQKLLISLLWISECFALQLQIGCDHRTGRLRTFHFNISFRTARLLYCIEGFRMRFTVRHWWSLLGWYSLVSFSSSEIIWLVEFRSVRTHLHRRSS